MRWAALPHTDAEIDGLMRPPADEALACGLEALADTLWARHRAEKFLGEAGSNGPGNSKEEAGSLLTEAVGCLEEALSIHQKLHEHPLDEALAPKVPEPAERPKTDSSSRTPSSSIDDSRCSDSPAPALEPAECQRLSAKKKKLEAQLKALLGEPESHRADPTELEK